MKNKNSKQNISTVELLFNIFRYLLTIPASYCLKILFMIVLAKMFSQVFFLSCAKRRERHEKTGERVFFLSA